MADECWEGDHAIYSMTVAIPAFIVWGIGFPFLAFMNIYKLYSARKLWDLEPKQVFGFLFLGYERPKYWWELLILMRKVVILASLIWLNQISVIVQALCAMMLLIVAIYL